mgnify:CR=1 FL=1
MLMYYFFDFLLFLRALLLRALLLRALLLKYCN